LNIQSAEGAKKKKKKRAHLRDARLAHKLGATAATAAAAAHWLAKLCVHWGHLQEEAAGREVPKRCVRTAKCKKAPQPAPATATEFVSYMRQPAGRAVRNY
jgi:hypothetical protein